LCCDPRNALENGALEIQLEHHAQNAGEPRVHRHRKVECEDVARFEKRVEPRERLRFARFGLGRICSSRRAKRPVHGRVVIEEREEDDHTFRYGRPKARVQTTPSVTVPTLHGFELVSTICPARALRAAYLERDAVFREIRFQIGLVGVRHLTWAFRKPVLPWCVGAVQLVLRARHQQDFGGL
jgi:hypothetical protein